MQHQISWCSGSCSCNAVKAKRAAAINSSQPSTLTVFTRVAYSALRFILKIDSITVSTQRASERVEASSRGTVKTSWARSWRLKWKNAAGSSGALQTYSSPTATHVSTGRTNKRGYRSRRAEMACRAWTTASDNTRWRMCGASTGTIVSSIAITDRRH